MATRLSILNHLLSVIGEAPVSNFDSLHPSAISAREVIKGVNSELQTQGYWFNTEYNLKIQPTLTGELYLPSNTLRVDPKSLRSPLVQRGRRLYDPVKSTFFINQPEVCCVVLELAYEELPESAANYIKHKAAYDFYVGDDGDESKSNRLLGRANDAWILFKKEELAARDTNAMLRPAVQQVRMGVQTYGNQIRNPNFPGGSG